MNLERAGLLETRRGVGTFVVARPERVLPTPADRRGDLAAIVRRLLNEAAARGFTPDDVARQIRDISGKRGG
jgi:DNA-binding transcriptional regulator YhcF (GntR family)